MYSNTRSSMPFCRACARARGATSHRTGRKRRRRTGSSDLILVPCMFPAWKPGDQCLTVLCACGPSAACGRTSWGLARLPALAGQARSGRGRIVRGRTCPAHAAVTVGSVFTQARCRRDGDHFLAHAVYPLSSSVQMLRDIRAPPVPGSLPPGRRLVRSSAVVWRAEGGSRGDHLEQIRPAGGRWRSFNSRPLWINIFLLDVASRAKQRMAWQHGPAGEPVIVDFLLC